MIGRRGSLLRKSAAPPRRAHQSQPEQGTQGMHGQRCLNFGMHGLFVSFRSSSSPMARATASFVAESKKVTFDVKYFRPETSTPVDELCDGTPLAASRYGRPERRRHGRRNNSSRRPNQEPCRVADQRSVAVGPVEWARRGNITVASIGPPRQSAAAIRQSAPAIVERSSVRRLGAGRSGERTFPSPRVQGLGEDRCGKHRSERDSSD